MVKTRSILIFIMFIISINTYSQKNVDKKFKIEVIQQKLDSATKISVRDTIKSFSLIKQAYNLSSENKLDSLKFMSELIKLDILGLLESDGENNIRKADQIIRSNKDKYYYITFIANLKKVNEYIKLDRHFEAINVITNNIDQKKASKYGREFLYLKLNEAMCYSATKQYPKAIDGFRFVIDEALNQNINQYVFGAYNNLAGLYADQNLMSKSIEMDYLALKYCKITDIRYAQVCRNLANKLISVEKYDEAIDLLKKLFDGRPLKNSIKASILSIIGENYTHKLQFDSAFVYLTKSMKVIEDNNLNESKAYVLAQLGLYNAKNKDHKKAIEFYSKSISYFKIYNADDESTLIDVYKYMFESFNKTDTSYNFVNQYISLTDTINSKNLRSIITKHDLEYETEKKNSKIIALEKNKVENELKQSNLSNLNFQLILRNERNESEKNKVENQNEILKLNETKTMLENERLIVVNVSQKKEVESKNKILRIIKSFLAGIFSLLVLLAYFLWSRIKLNHKLEAQKNQISLLNSELNHRVKNNLAFMTSLLEMQGRRTPNEEAKEILRESESRLKTLSLVHANLYQNNQNTQINLNHYLSEITNHLSQYFSIPNKDLAINTDFIDHQCDAEDAMRLGLIVNELVTNSVKHAFHEVENPSIDITTSKNEDGKVVLSYRDNGPGVAVNAGSTANKDISLGVKLIGLLKEQLGERYLIV